jgi:hypothetical protein
MISIHAGLKLTALFALKLLADSDILNRYPRIVFFEQPLDVNLLEHIIDLAALLLPDEQSGFFSILPDDHSQLAFMQVLVLEYPDALVVWVQE